MVELKGHTKCRWWLLIAQGMESKILNKGLHNLVPVFLSFLTALPISLCSANSFLFLKGAMFSLASGPFHVLSSLLRMFFLTFVWLFHPILGLRHCSFWEVSPPPIPSRAVSGVSLCTSFISLTFILRSKLLFSYLFLPLECKGVELVLLTVLSTNT